MARGGEATAWRRGVLRWMALAWCGLSAACNLLIGLDAGRDLCTGVRCPAPDACHLDGDCDPETGQCLNRPLGDGTPCDDGDGCTQRDTCQGGVCAGGEPVEMTCSPVSPCHVDACNPKTGTCAGEDGLACDDGDSCTQGETCHAGICNRERDRSWAHWNPELTPAYAIGSETVGDPVTGLVWQRELAPAKLSWEEASSYCKSLSLPGYPSGFRLPSRIELLSIVDYRQPSPKIDVDAFSGTPPDSLWTSTKSPLDATTAYRIFFGTGAILDESLTEKLYVRCVR